MSVSVGAKFEPIRAGIFFVCVDFSGKELIKVGVLLPAILIGVLSHTTSFNLTQ